MRTETPDRDSKAAAINPVGPEPTMTTSMEGVAADSVVMDSGVGIDCLRRVTRREGEDLL